MEKWYNYYKPQNIWNSHTYITYIQNLLQSNTGRNMDRYRSILSMNNKKIKYDIS
jgi:hypothetical protein